MLSISQEAIRRAKAGAFRVQLIALLLFALLFLTPEKGFAQKSNAKLQEISESRKWRALLHVASLLSPAKSLVDSDEFFLSSEGKLDPLGELEATLELVFSEEASTALHFRCKFPARAQFISQEIYGKEIDFSECSELSRWLEQFPQAQLSLVFAGSYLRNPASVFGHTFLRIDSAQWRSPLLQQTISYGASASDSPGPVFAFKGLTGLYKASYRLSPYHLHIREYLDIEDRELFEFPLAYSQKEVREILLHLWELQHAEFDYYFIDENCSYNLLSLLEVARPELKLIERFRFHTVPLDVLRVLLEGVGLRGDVLHRKAPSESLRVRYQSLPDGQQTLVRALSKQEEVSIEELERADPEAIEVVLDYKEYLSENSEEESSLQKELLLERSSHRSRTGRSVEKLKEFKLPHFSSRLSLGLAHQQNDTYARFGFRFLYHENTDSALVYPLGSEMEFLKFLFEIDSSDADFRLEELLLFNLKAEPLFDTLLRPITWELALGAKRRRFDIQKTSLVSEFAARLGVSTELAPGLRWGALLGGSLQGNGRFQDSFASSADAKINLRMRTPSESAVEFEALGRRYLTGAQRSGFELALRYPLWATDEYNVVASIGRRQEFADSYGVAEISVRRYF